MGLVAPFADIAKDTTLGLINAKTPSLGQSNKAGSVPVTLATDQGPTAVTGTFWQTTQPVSGTVGVSGSVAVTGTFWQATQPVSIAGSVAVTGTFFQATQPVSAVSLPLPTGAATETTLATIAGAVRAEDSAHVSGQTGIPMLGIRQAADTPSSDADGDYTLAKFDEEGRLKTATKPASYAPTTGTITANAQTIFTNCERFSNLMLHCFGTFSTVNVAFEGSLNSTNGTDGNWFAVQAVRSNANTIETTTGNLSAAPAYAWELSVNALKYFRIRATAFTSGTQSWVFVPGTYATEPIPAAQASATQAVSGTVTATVTAGTVNPVVPATPYFVNSAASTNGALILTGTSGLQSFYATNEGASVAYVKLYNKATAPTVGTDVPEMIIPIPAAASGVPGVAMLPIGFSGFRFALGLGIAITRNAVFSDTTAVGAGEVKVKLSRTI